MKHCISCGTKLQPEDRFCPECGSRIAKSEKTEYEPAREYAGLMIRVLAFCADVIALSVFVIIVRAVTGLMKPPTIAWVLLLFLPYSTWMIARKGATPGKRFFNLRITRTEGNRVGYWCSFIRTCSIPLGLMLLGLGILWISIDPKKQGFHDKIANTVVVRVKE